MAVTIKTRYNKVISVTCDDCDRLVPFVQPELSQDKTEVIIYEHACPVQMLAVVQEELAAIQLDTNQ